MKVFYIVDMSTSAVSTITGHTWEEAVQLYTGFSARSITHYGNLTIFIAGKRTYVLTYG